MTNRFMRILVMFDLPTGSKEDRYQYTIFRRFLIENGYDMLQYSVYTRICPNKDWVQAHQKRLKAWAPKDGAVRVMIVTNKQFAEAVILTGEKKPQEKKIHEGQLLLF